MSRILKVFNGMALDTSPPLCYKAPDISDSGDMRRDGKRSEAK